MKAIAQNEEADVRKVLKMYKDNHKQYVEDFCLPDDPIEQRERLFPTRQPSISSSISNTSRNIEFIKARKHKRKTLNAVKV